MVLKSGTKIHLKNSTAISLSRNYDLFSENIVYKPRCELCHVAAIGFFNQTASYQCTEENMTWCSHGREAHAPGINGVLLERAVSLAGIVGGHLTMTKCMTQKENISITKLTTRSVD